VRKSAGSSIFWPGAKEGRPRYGQPAHRNASPSPHCAAASASAKLCLHYGWRRRAAWQAGRPLAAPTAAHPRQPATSWKCKVCSPDSLHIRSQNSLFKQTARSAALPALPVVGPATLELPWPPQPPEHAKRAAPLSSQRARGCSRARTLPHALCGFSSMSGVSAALTPAASASARPQEQLAHAFLLAPGAQSAAAAPSGPLASASRACVHFKKTKHAQLRVTKRENDIL